MFIKWHSSHRLPIPELRIIEGSAFIARVSVCHVGAPNFHDNCLVPVGPAQDDRHHVDVEVELWKLQTAVRYPSEMMFASGGQFDCLFENLFETLVQNLSQKDFKPCAIQLNLQKSF